MVAVWAGFRPLGTVGALKTADAWVGTVRYSLTTMFAVTGFLHFLPFTCPDLAACPG